MSKHISHLAFVVVLLSMLNAAPVACGQQQQPKEPTRAEMRKHERAVRALAQGLGGNHVVTHLIDGEYRTFATFRQPVVDPALKYLEDLYNLKELDLVGSGVTDKGCRELSKLTSLEVLHIYNTSLGDEALKQVSGLPNLWRIEASSCRNITDAGVEHLRGMKSLKDLTLYGTSITDKSLEYLAGLPLEALQVGNTGITPEAWAKFKAERPGLTEDTGKFWRGRIGAKAEAGFGN